jgi:hypothetical protein
MVQRKNSDNLRYVWRPNYSFQPNPIENTSVLLYRCQMFVHLIFNLCNVEPMSLGWLGSAIWIIFCDATMWAIKIIWMCLCENCIQSIVFSELYIKLYCNAIIYWVYSFLNYIEKGCPVIFLLVFWWFDTDRENNSSDGSSGNYHR